ncbi:MAG: sulfite exporter TauE/SafE family protein [Hyphomonadaceae bacterium]|nr:sulfite exporter TauE/SafE family protein [Hyphomonadaceae bacterium]MCA8886556.1 sulfite exporter TauE/SafE family protein [Hyphomonadaceae bacterium]
MDWQAIAALISGSGVGFLLGLLGGGGSVLAVPLLLYFVGVPNTHFAIGTSALGVSVNAAANLLGHARRGTVKWPCAITFALAGIAGAALGSTIGKLIDPEPLMLMFALAMAAVALSMWRPASGDGLADVQLNPRIAVRLVGIGLVVGLASGFFGIGGGFLIVPGLMLGSRMPMLNAVGSSLLAVALFGATTAFNYALSGYVLWDVAGWMIAGGIVGGAIGVWASRKLAARRALLQRVFAVFVLVVAAYVAYRGLSAGV